MPPEHRPRSRRRSRSAAPPQRGAALLVAMVLLTVVSTLAAGMVWQQWRAVQVEIAERARAQSGLILAGGLDFARLLLRENARASDGHTKLHELLGQPLAEMRLSTLLAADRDNSADADVDAFLSGRLADAQARYNLLNLVADNKVVPAQLQVLERLCSNAGLPGGTAAQVAGQLLLALQGEDSAAPLMPQQVADLAWFGLDAATVERLAAFVVLLPVPTPVNINTAPREVLAAVLPGLDLGGADRLVRQRPFRDLEAVRTALGTPAPPDAALVDVRSAYFEVTGRIRLGERVVEQLTLVERRTGLQVLAVQRLRTPPAPPAAPAR